jgi:hypothetical protein
MGEMMTMAMSWELLPSPGESTRELNPSGMDIDVLGKKFSDLIAPVEEGQGIEKLTDGRNFDSGRGQSLGTMFVAKLDAVGTDFKNNIERAYSTFERTPEDISLVDVMKAQYEMAVVTLQIDVVGKGVQKSVQNAESFLKMQ